MFPSSYRNHHQTFHGHTYRIIDKVTSLQFQHQQPLDSVYNNRRCSAETILSVKKENDKKNQIVYMKPTPVIRKPTNKKRQISFSPLPPKCDTEDDDNESEEEYYTNTTIHVAVRRDASLFKIEKVSKNPLGTAILRPVNNHNDTITAEVQQQEQQQCTEKQDKKEDVGLPTPPNSPQDVYSDTSKERISSESDLDLNTLPQIIHVHKAS